MRFGLDYAWTTISVSAHRAIGSTFACRYLSTDPSKNLSLAEAEILRAGGIDVLVVWETAAMRALSGTSAGATDARDALAQAEALKMPAGRPIYFAVDFDETPTEATEVADYFKGVNSVLGASRSGVYGGYWVVKRLLDAGLVKYAWQTYAWSGGQVDHRAQLYQYSNGHVVDGQSCDYNHSLAPDFGQWSYKTSSPTSPPSPPPTKEQITVITSARNSSGDLNVFVVGPDQKTVWYTYTKGDNWNGGEAGKQIAGLSPFAPAARQNVVGLTAGQNAHGDLQVIAEMADGSLQYTYQLANQTGWSGGKAGVAVAGFSPLAPAPSH